MASLVLGGVGRLVAGALFPGSPFAGFLFGAVGTSIGNALLPADGGRFRGPTLKDLKVSASTYGAGIPITAGSVRIAGNIIWAADLVALHRADNGKISGGKGGGGVTIETVEYFAVMAVAFCEGPVQAVRRIWADGLLIVDLTAANADGMTHRYGPERTRVYLGGEDQQPDPTIEAHLGAGNAPGHRGLCYVVFDHLPLADFGNRVPNITAEVVRVATLSYGQIDHSASFTAPFATDRWALDPVRPHLWNLHQDKVLRLNRLTGERAFQTSIRDVSGFLDAWTALGGETDPNTTGLPWADPLSGNVYVGVVDNSISGFAVFDPDLRFIDAKAGGLPTRGRAVSFGGRTLVFFHQQAPARLVSYVWQTVSAGGAGGGAIAELALIEESDETAGWGTDFAFDVLGGRGWALTADGGDNGTVSLTPIAADGTFGTRASTNDLGLPLPNTAHGIAYDRLTDALILITGAALYRLDPETLAVLDSVPIAAGGDSDSFFNAQDAVSGTVRTVSGASDFRLYDTRDFSLTDQYDTGDTHGKAIDGPVWDGQVGALWTFGGPGQHQLFFDKVTADPVPLSDIVADLCAHAGLAASEVDAAALTETVTGYVVTPPLTARKAIEPLQLAFAFDGAEIDYAVRFVHRDGASAATIAETELVADDGDEQVRRLVETRTQEVELPVRVAVDYMDQANDYQTATQQAKRIQDVTGSLNAFALELPVVLTHDQAKTAAARLLGAAWGERHGAEFRLSPDRLALDPTDVVTIARAGGGEIDIRLTAVGTGADGVLRCRGVLHRPAVFAQALSGVTPGGAPARPIPFLVPSRVFALDTPVLDYPDDDDGGYYVGAAPAFYAEGLDWRGAAILRAESAEGDFTQITATLEATPWFLADAALPAQPRWTVWDMDNVLTVRMQTDDVLESASDIDVLNGANALFLGGEVIQFAVATETAPRTYALSRLLRGRLGTEVFMDGHAAGEAGVVLRAGTIERVTGFSAIGKTLYFQALTAGRQLVPPATLAFNATGAALKPYAPAHLAGARDGGGTLTLSFVRRTRFNGGLKDGTGTVPLNEESEAYEIDIYAGASAVRTIATAAASAVYTASAQLADFGSVQAAVTVGVFQISGQVGRGYEAKATL